MNITAAMNNVIATAFADRQHLIRSIAFDVILLCLAIPTILGCFVIITLTWPECLDSPRLLVLMLLVAVARLLLAIGLTSIRLTLRLALSEIKSTIYHTHDNATTVVWLIKS